MAGDSTGLPDPLRPVNLDRVQLRHGLFFATSSSIFSWSIDTQVVQQISTFPSYEIEISPTGRLFVGNGGADSVPSGVPTAGIFQIDASGQAVAFSSLPADDLEFDANGTLYASNSSGIFRLQPDGTSTKVSENPTAKYLIWLKCVRGAVNSVAPLVGPVGEAHPLG